MNYHRRTTRPDGLYYRETRKRVGSSHGGRRRHRGGFHPLFLLMLVALLVVAGVWLFRR
jgi:hypothetical protein